MYISEVSGHHSATIAIEKALRSIAPDTQIMNINAFNYTNPISEKIINRLYMSVIKSTPGIWDFLYDNPTVAKKLEKIKQRIHKQNSPKLHKLFNSFKPDIVACTQAFPCGMVADYKKYHSTPIKLIAVLTDYVPHSYWVYDTVDYYITPCPQVSERLVKKGVPEERIKDYGIPFNHTFDTKLHKPQIIEKLGLNPHIPRILIMGGGQGLGPIAKVVDSLEKLQAPLQELIVTGTNKKVYRQIKRKLSRCHKKIVLFGYTDKINELMTISDIIITKPGGITTAEALTKNVPMLIIKPIPGQEANNTVYLTSQGAAIKIDDPRDTATIIHRLLTQPQELQRMRDAAEKIAKPQASLDIAKFFLSL